MCLALSGGFGSPIYIHSALSAEMGDLGSRKMISAAITPAIATVPETIKSYPSNPTAKPHKAGTSQIAELAVFPWATVLVATP